MSGPDGIWAWEIDNNTVPPNGYYAIAEVDDAHEYARRDPAVIAALPEVQALVAEAVAQERERCAKVAEGYWSGIPESEVGEAVCDAVFAVAAAIRAGGKP